MSDSVFIGIDPGKAGGLARIVNGRAEACPMPDTERDIWDVLRSWIDDDAYQFAVIERVGPTPQMGVTSSFTFGNGYGGLRMALIASGMEWDDVSPQRWQADMGLRMKGGKGVTAPDRSERTKIKKLAAKAKAQQLFPYLKVTNAIADALLIAEYIRRLKTGISVTPGKFDL